MSFFSGKAADLTKDYSKKNMFKTDSWVLGGTELVNTFMQDVRARARLGIGGSRLRSRVVNPFGSGPLDRSTDYPVTPPQLQAAPSTTPTPSTLSTTPAPDLAPSVDASFEPGTYQYFDLVFTTDKYTTPDNPFYRLLQSKYARKVG